MEEVVGVDLLSMAVIQMAMAAQEVEVPSGKWSLGTRPATLTTLHYIRNGLGRKS